MPVITLLTDFGTRDGFVGTTKGVILARCPEARLVDLTHELEPGDVRGGALLLRAAVGYFPPGTVHVAVVDPGVGGPRRPLVISAGEQRFVGPDNGVLWPAAVSGIQAVEGRGSRVEGRGSRVEGGGLRVFELREARYRLPAVSATFHGRDVFAPAAAFLACGEPVEAMGPACPDPQTLELPAARVEGARVEGEVIWIDRFGNAVTNLEPEVVRCHAGERFVLQAGSGRIEGPSTYYGAVPEGELVVVLGSLGYYEIAVNRGSAVEALGLIRGAAVLLERL